MSATDLDNETTTEQMTFNAAPVTREFEYDANGNLTTDKSGGVVQRSFTWDGKNRLKSVTVGSNTWSWDYDYLDRRRKERLNGTEVKRFIWADTELVQERSSTNAITRTHYFGGFVVISGTKKYLTTADHLGNVREVISANAAAGTVGSVQARYDYSAYQGPTKVSGTTVDATMLTIGRYYNHEGSGLELAKYRAYDPELGRWISEDPAEEYGGLNLYAVNANNPASRIDLLGLSPQTDQEFANQFKCHCLVEQINALRQGLEDLKTVRKKGGYHNLTDVFNELALLGSVAVGQAGQGLTQAGAGLPLSPCMQDFIDGVEHWRDFNADPQNIGHLGITIGSGQGGYAEARLWLDAEIDRMSNLIHRLRESVLPKFVEPKFCGNNKYRRHY